jgi:hypothetical protein
MIAENGLEEGLILEFSDLSVQALNLWRILLHYDPCFILELFEVSDLCES